MQPWQNWVRFPTRLPTSPEIVELIHQHKTAGQAAAFIHLSAIAWSAAHETEGDVYKGLLPLLGGKPRQAALLVESGLWQPIEKGWWIVDFWECMAPERRAHIPVALRAAVYERDGNACLACGSTERLSLDHIVHWSAGGEDSLENLRTLCQPCNSSRRTRTDAEWGRI